MADALNLEGLEFLSHPDAEPRFTAKPPEWIATFLPRYCFAVADRTESDCRGLAQVVRELHRDDFWRQLFPDWETCCQALFKRPAAWVEQVVEGVRVLHAQGHQGEIPATQALAAMAQTLEPAGPPPAAGMPSPNPAGRKGKEHGNDSCLVPRVTGNRQDAILRRIKRDHPDIAERIERGEFKSARAAGMAAGFIKPSPPSVRLTDPAKVADKIRQHWPPEQITALVEALL